MYVLHHLHPSGVSVECGDKSMFAAELESLNDQYQALSKNNMTSLHPFANFTESLDAYNCIAHSPAHVVTISKIVLEPGRSTYLYPDSSRIKGLRHCSYRFSADAALIYYFTAASSSDVATSLIVESTTQRSIQTKCIQRIDKKLNVEFLETKN